MRILVPLCFAVIALVASACGGGGGSANQGVATGTASLTMELRDSNGAVTNAVSGSGVTLRAIVRGANGALVRDALVTFSGDTSLVTFSPASGQVLSDASGVAMVQVSPASALASGAGRLSAASTIGTTAVVAGLNFQLAASNVALSGLDLGSAPLAAFGSRPVSVVATINGSAAANTPVQVTFQASCGTISPATVSTDSTGKAVTTYSASTIACAGGNASITASASGAAPLQGALAILPPAATNIQFVSASPQLLYLRNSVGATQSQLLFKVVDANGTALQNQLVQLSLVTNAQTGVSLGTLGNAAPVNVSSNADGDVSVTVFAGTVPTSVQVRAVLASNAAVEAISNLLRVASGRPAQKAASVGVTIFAIEGYSRDGATTEVTMSLADRQGNPVPDGTQVNFTAEAGVLIPPTCTVTGGQSACTVTLRSQGTRPDNGRVSVLAYVAGEEDFVDANANNMYDPGESFTDLGDAYRDDNQNTTHDLGEFSVPRGGLVSCAGGPNGRANTCDGVWGAVDVRGQAEVAFSTSNGVISTLASDGNAVRVVVQDRNGNSMATGSKIEVSVTSTLAASTCSAKSDVDKVPNDAPLRPLTFDIALKDCVSGDTINIKVTSPSDTVTNGSYAVP